MQSDNKEIYKLTAERTGKSEQLYKDIGNFIFRDLYENMRKPNNLILRLKGIGKWYLRRQRMEIAVSTPPDPGKTREDYSSEDEWIDYFERCNTIALFKERLKDYEQYIKERDDVRSERWKVQKLITRKDE